jgi:hypothetical protein
MIVHAAGRGDRSRRLRVNVTCGAKQQRPYQCSSKFLQLATSW